MAGLVRILVLSVAAAWLCLGPAVASAWTEDYQDVTGMKAIYDPQTGNLRFEGLFNIHAVGIGRTENVAFRPEGAATTRSSFSVANQDEVGWLFFDGIEGGGFDAGAIFPTGLGDSLSDFYIGVTTMGSGKRITPIPIYTSTASYLPSFDLYAGYYEPLQPPVVEPPVELQPVQLPPDLGLVVVDPVVIDPVSPVIPVEPVLSAVLELPSPAVDPPANNRPDWSVDLPPAVPVVTELEPADSVMVVQPHVVDISQDEFVFVTPVEPVIPPTVEGLFPGDQSVNLTINDGLSFFPENGLINYCNWRNLDGALELWSTNELSVNLVDYSEVVDLSALLMTNRSLLQLHAESTLNTLEVHTMGFATFLRGNSVQTTIPEPASGAAMLSALAGWGAFRRRLRRAARPAV